MEKYVIGRNLRFDKNRKFYNYSHDGSSAELAPIDFSLFKSDDSYEYRKYLWFCLEEPTFIHVEPFGDVVAIPIYHVEWIRPSEYGIKVFCNWIGSKTFFYCDELIPAERTLSECIDNFLADRDLYFNVRNGHGAYGYYDRSSDFQRWRKDLASSHDKYEDSWSKYVDNLIYELRSL